MSLFDGLVTKPRARPNAAAPENTQRPTVDEITSTSSFQPSQGIPATTASAFSVGLNSPDGSSSPISSMSIDYHHPLVTSSVHDEGNDSFYKVPPKLNKRERFFKRPGYAAKYDAEVAPQKIVTSIRTSKNDFSLQEQGMKQDAFEVSHSPAIVESYNMQRGAYTKPKNAFLPANATCERFNTIQSSDSRSLGESRYEVQRADLSMKVAPAEEQETPVDGDFGYIGQFHVDGISRDSEEGSESTHSVIHPPMGVKVASSEIRLETSSFSSSPKLAFTIVETPPIPEKPHFQRNEAANEGASSANSLSPQTAAAPSSDVKVGKDTKDMQKFYEDAANELFCAMRHYFDIEAAEARRMELCSEDEAAQKSLINKLQEEQAVLVEEEKFEDADALDMRMKQIESMLSSRKSSVPDILFLRRGYSEELLKIAKDFEKLCEDAVSELREFTEEKKEEFHAFKKRSESFLAIESLRLEQENERISLSEMHFKSEEKQFLKESDEVANAIKTRSQFYLDKKEEAMKTKSELDEEIKKLEEQISFKVSKRDEIVETISSLDVRLEEIQMKFSRQLQRVRDGVNRLQKNGKELESDKRELLELKGRCVVEQRMYQEAKLMRESQVSAAEDAMDKFLKLLCFGGKYSEIRRLWHQTSGLHLCEVKSKSAEIEKHNLLLRDLKAEVDETESNYELLRNTISEINLVLLPSLNNKKAQAVSTRSFKEASQLKREIEGLTAKLEEDKVTFAEIEESLKEKKQKLQEVEDLAPSLWAQFQEQLNKGYIALVCDTKDQLKELKRLQKIMKNIDTSFRSFLSDEYHHLKYVIHAIKGNLQLTGSSDSIWISSSEDNEDEDERRDDEEEAERLNSEDQHKNEEECNDEGNAGRSHINESDSSVRDHYDDSVEESVSEEKSSVGTLTLQGKGVRNSANLTIVNGCSQPADNSNAVSVAEVDELAEDLPGKMAETAVEGENEVNSGGSEDCDANSENTEIESKIDYSAINEQILELERDCEAAIQSENFEDAAALDEKIQKLKAL